MRQVAGAKLEAAVAHKGQQSPPPPPRALCSPCLVCTSMPRVSAYAFLPTRCPPHPRAVARQVTAQAGSVTGRAQPPRVDASRLHRNPWGTLWWPPSVSEGSPSLVRVVPGCAGSVTSAGRRRGRTTINDPHHTGGSTQGHECTRMNSGAKSPGGPGVQTTDKGSGIPIEPQAQT